MNLHALAAEDLKNILEDDQTGLGWPMTITDPSGNSASVIGRWRDIAQDFDDGTGVPVAGRTAGIVMRLQALTDEGLEMPREIPDTDSKPWRVTLLDTTGATRNYKIAFVEPDTSRGLVRCELEEFKPA